MERFRWLSLIMLYMLSFHLKGQTDYVKYQTFDEYKMEGVGYDKKIKRPYVFVKKEVDTISVIKSNDRDKVIKYVNRGDYWHTIFQIAEKLSYIETICEKFIYNDTVIEYKYKYSHQYGYLCAGIIDSSKRSNQRYHCDIFVHTKKDCLILSIQSNDIKNYDAPFSEIKEFVINHNEIFPLYSPDYQLRWYSIYKKQVKDNILSIYEVDSTNKEFVSSKKMNSLGEFDNNGTMAWWW